MFKKISEISERLTLYARTDIAFWDDPYISKQMLKAHLDPEFDGASRKLQFIENSVSWIKEIVPPAKHPHLLDIGCGPGIYAEKFTKAGYQVTGIDFSKRSIKYARQSAQKQELHITYHYQNYLAMKLDTVYDFATMIYCDYGALSTLDRQLLMKNVFNHLVVGGRFLLDVFSLAKYDKFKEKQIWKLHLNGGFWRKDAYLELSRNYQYLENVTLEQTTIISNHEVITYHIWNTYFTKETIIKEAKEAGFKVCELYGDVAGTMYHEASCTIAILLEKCAS